MDNLLPGNYIIRSGIDGNPVNTCPPEAPADVVILSNPTTVGLAAQAYMAYVKISMSTGYHHGHRPVSLCLHPDQWRICRTGRG